MPHTHAFPLFSFSVSNNSSLLGILTIATVYMYTKLITKVFVMLLNTRLTCAHTQQHILCTMIQWIISVGGIFMKSFVFFGSKFHGTSLDNTQLGFLRQNSIGMIEHFSSMRGYHVYKYILETSIEDYK